MQSVKANAPWRMRAAAEDSLPVEECCVISRECFLASRLVSLRPKQSEFPEAKGLRTMSTLALEEAAPASECEAPMLSLPPGLEHLQDCDLATSDSDVSTTAPESCTSPSEVQAVSDNHALEPEEYKVLLQNLPASLLKDTMLRSMISKAKLKDVKKLAFKADGRALITFTTYASSQKCIEHFNGLPWFFSATAAVPTVVATLVQKATTTTPHAQMNRPTFTLSAEAPVFVPGSLANIPAVNVEASDLTSPSCKLRERTRCSSHASTDGGSSSDETSCSSDSEAEAQTTCV